MYVTAGQGLGQIPMLAQQFPKHLPDWMRLYLQNVDANYRYYTSLFFILSAHPTPYSVRSLRALADKIVFERGTPSFWWGELRSVLRQIRTRREMQDNDFHPLRPWQLVKEVEKRFEDFKPEDLKPFLIEVLLASGRVGKNTRGSDPKNWTGPYLFSRGPSWNLGNRLVREKLPPELSKRVRDSPWYVQEVINARMANALWVMANQLQYKNLTFRKELEMNEKARAIRP